MSFVVVFALGYLLGGAVVVVLAYLTITARRRSIERSIRAYQRPTKKRD